MQKEFVIRAYALIKDAQNPNNGFLVKCAIDELFHRIEIDKMNTLEDYIAFKDEWYTQIKNK